ncbi:MAG: Na/Pi cotransporter family protein [Candidatus Sedimenticola sp. (ex Thyasira tokunagai)]
MLKKIFLPTIFLILIYGFWVSPDFKEIAAGVSVFLFGMLSLEEGFKAFTGGALEKLLRKTTDKLWKSVAFGVVSTTVMQSSSLVSVITISFLSAGLIGLAAGIGIIFGANLGTTTGAWLVAGFGLKVKISAYAMPMLVFGIILIFQKAKSLKGIGYILAGLGFLFLGIHYMKEGFEAFKDSINLAEYAVSGYGGVFLFATIGILSTVVMQSSHATLVLTITALAAGQITYENALGLAIGANVGTTITAIIGSMSANEQGKRLAGAHLIFNMTTGLIAIAFIFQLMGIVDRVSAGVGIAADDYTLKLAVFHTIFNLIGVSVMLPFTNPMVNFLESYIKAKPVDISEPRYLDDSALDFPDTAVEALRKETLHAFDNSVDIITRGLGVPREAISPDTDLEAYLKAQKKPLTCNIDDSYRRKVKTLYNAIIAFVSKASFTWEMDQSEALHWFRNATRDMVQALKDIKHMQDNMQRYLVSENEDIRAEYNAMRLEIGLTLQELEKIREYDDPEHAATTLQALKLSLHDTDTEFNDVSVRMISKGSITPEMGTSLMNDSAYTHDVIRNLIEVGETIFVARAQDVSEEQRKILLGEDEMSDNLDEVI